jgi:hypothetical protein
MRVDGAYRLQEISALIIRLKAGQLPVEKQEVWVQTANRAGDLPEIYHFIHNYSIGFVFEQKAERRPQRHLIVGKNDTHWLVPMLALENKTAPDLPTLYALSEHNALVMRRKPNSPRVGFLT